MRRLYLFGIIFLLFVVLFGCSSNSIPEDSNNVNDLKNEKSTIENSIGSVKHPDKENVDEIDESTIEEKQDMNSSNSSLSTSQQASVSKEEMELLKETLRTYIFDEYMPGADYVYAKGVNWTGEFL